MGVRGKAMWWWQWAVGGVGVLLAVVVAFDHPVFVPVPWLMAATPLPRGNFCVGLT